MKHPKGFTPAIYLLIATSMLALSALGYKSFQIASQKTNLSPTITPSPTIYLSSTPITFSTLPPPTTITPSTGIIRVSLTNQNQPLTDTTLTLHIRNEIIQEEKIYNNTNSLWEIRDVNPGKYKVTIPFIYTNYYSPERNCQGCRNQEDKSENQVCGFVFSLQAGDNVKISCSLRKATQLNLPNSAQPDTLPPRTYIFYPQPNGTITYKTDGKVCAYENPPTDNGASTEGIQTFYKFDDRDWQSGIGYLCADSLPNGPHTISFYSKDKAGNVESTTTFPFTVDIPGN